MSSPAVDIERLPPPRVVEPLDYEAILAALKADLIARAPDLEPALSLESEPLTKLLEVAAWREMLLRQRINDAARATMLAYATGSDLDHLAARYDLARLPSEDDERFRRRVLIAYHGLSAAGSPQSWMLRALSVSVDVRQVDVWASQPGRVKVAILARVEADADSLTAEQEAVGLRLFGTHPQASASPPKRWRVATAADPIVAQVEAALLAEDVRPLTVDVDVTAATVIAVPVVAHLIHQRGPDSATIIAAARKKLVEAAERVAFRVDLTRALIIATLMVDGVRDVELSAPSSNVPAGPGEIAVPSTITLTAEMRHD